MKATKIYYEELRTGNGFNNKKIGIELELAEGEKASEAIYKAKLFVQSELSNGGISADLLESFVRQIKNTQESLKDLSEKAQQGLPYDDEIPF